MPPPSNLHSITMSALKVFQNDNKSRCMIYGKHMVFMSRLSQLNYASGEMQFIQGEGLSLYHIITVMFIISTDCVSNVRKCCLCGCRITLNEFLESLAPRTLSPFSSARVQNISLKKFLCNCADKGNEYVQCSFNDNSFI